MTAKYIFRLDDICENMNWDNYSRIKSIFLDNNIKPLIGVIPKNEDKELLKYPICNFNFWQEIRDLNSNKGWTVALHGFNHVLDSSDSGMLKINNRSEFASLPRIKQNEKVVKGISILKQNGIEIDAFMAPAHSFDQTTLECLRENNIHTITDGYSLFPYYEDGILFVPQLFSRPLKMPFGVYTWCLHLNSMNESNFYHLEAFIKENLEDIICFNESKHYIKNNIFIKIQSFLLKNSIVLARKVRNKRGN